MKEVRTIKRIGLLIILTIVASFFCISAAAQEFDGYVVKLAPSSANMISLFEESTPLQRLGYQKVETEAQARLLVDFGVAISYEPDYIAELFDESYEPVDTRYSSQYVPQQAGADQVWKLGFYGEGVTVAIIDSGCSEHIDITNRIKYSYNVFSQSSPDLFPDPSDVTDEFGHGTHVAGIVAGELNGKGMVGIAPKCDLAIIKAFTKQPDLKTTSSVLAGAIEYIVNNTDTDIINMSLGMSGSTDVFKTAVDLAISRGIIICAANGNDGNTTSELSYPAAYEDVIGVCSLNRNGVRSSFSRANEAAFVSIGGESVLSLSNSGNDSYGIKSGTSMASPAVAGVIALVKSADNSLTRSEIFDLIIETAIDFGDYGYDYLYGHGMIDAYAMVYSRIPNEIFVSHESSFCINGVTKNYFSVCNKSSSPFLLIKAKYKNRKAIDFVNTIVDVGNVKKYSYELNNTDDITKMFFFENNTSLKPLRDFLTY